ncbi:hypothetical protein Ancab_022661 [Ancistrocladus abbreviatus]
METNPAKETAVAAPKPAVAAPKPAVPSNFIGKHRLLASISHLDQQIRIIQAELQELETIEGPSTVCGELVSGVESVPDPMLPIWLAFDSNRLTATLI